MVRIVNKVHAFVYYTDENDINHFCVGVSKWCKYFPRDVIREYQKGDYLTIKEIPLPHEKDMDIALDLLGGTYESDEDMFDALRREIFEESATTITIKKGSHSEESVTFIEEKKITYIRNYAKVRVSREDYFRSIEEFEDKRKEFALNTFLTEDERGPYLEMSKLLWFDETSFKKSVKYLLNGEFAEEAFKTFFP